MDGTASVNGKALRDLSLPPDVLALVIVRGEELITPRGSTVLALGDYVYLLAKERDRPALERLFQG